MLAASLSTVAVLSATCFLAVLPTANCNLWNSIENVYEQAHDGFHDFTEEAMGVINDELFGGAEAPSTFSPIVPNLLPHVPGVTSGVPYIPSGTIYASQLATTISPKLNLFVPSSPNTNGVEQCPANPLTFTPDTIPVFNSLPSYRQAFINKIQANPKLIIVAHGWRGLMCDEWVPIMVKNFMATQAAGTSVVFMDWSKSAATVNYLQAAADVKVVGESVADFFTQNYATINASNVHCIGHSLGSHVCSFLCERLLEKTGKRCGRLSGLDPAAPMFDNANYRIRKADADFVDVYHSSSLGLSDAVGHLDVFINDQTKTQPGCDALVGAQYGVCSHNVAALYFGRSIVDTTTTCFKLPTANPFCFCGSYNIFTGQCSTAGCSLRTVGYQTNYKTSSTSKIIALSLQRTETCWA